MHLYIFQTQNCVLSMELYTALVERLNAVAGKEAESKAFYEKYLTSVPASIHDVVKTIMSGKWRS